MLSLKVSDIVKATGGKLVNGSMDAEIHGLNSDTRKIKAGDFYIPFKGEKFDGHNFIEDALKAGAIGYLTSGVQVETNMECIVIKVEDTLRAYQSIAGFYRDNFKIPVVAVTGSAGKTSSKNMIYEVLSMKYKVLKTEGNLNNHIGLPATLLRLSPEHQIAVVEMGMNNLGEISTLSKIAKPDVAVITNIGLAHIGNLGSRQNILKAKMEIFDGMSPDGIAILNGDDGLLFGLKNLLNRKTIFYGIQDGMDIQAYNTKLTEEIYTTFDIQINNSDYSVLVPALGLYNVYNALAAIAVGLQFNIPMQDIIQGIRNFKNEKMRMNVVSLNRGIKVLNDAYNANPNSMQEALKVVKEFSGSRRIAILGDMLELGEWTRQAHFEVGENVARSKIDCLITLGENSRYIAEGAEKSGMPAEKIIVCNTISEVNESLKNIMHENDVILVKGSRGMHMEDIIDFISGVS